MLTLAKIRGQKPYKMQFQIYYALNVTLTKFQTI